MLACPERATRVRTKAPPTTTRTPSPICATAFEKSGPSSPHQTSSVANTAMTLPRVSQTERRDGRVSCSQAGASSSRGAEGGCSDPDGGAPVIATPSSTLRNKLAPASPLSRYLTPNTSLIGESQPLRHASPQTGLSYT